ncbi:MAG: metalloregulator ArsR/SmtB family transcription factor [Gemmatimonadota bacterium]|nr:metalloregulator ArsR/SmtB family transcription factor [Gemmatimonadota bacterium]
MIYQSAEVEFEKVDDDVLNRAAAVIKCLGHPLRLRLLEAMEFHDRTVTELQKYTGVNQATVSQQLSVLKGHGVVEGRRQGPFMVYRIVEPKVGSILNCIRGCGSPADRLHDR